jgi:hypothetical protein
VFKSGNPSREASGDIAGLAIVPMNVDFPQAVGPATNSSCFMNFIAVRARQTKTTDYGDSAPGSLPERLFLEVCDKRKIPAHVRLDRPICSVRFVSLRAEALTASRIVEQGLHRS